MIFALVAFVVGFGFALYSGRAATKARGGHITLSLAGPPDAAPRTCTLADLIEEARANALRVRPTSGGYDVIDQLSTPPAVISVRVNDPARVTLATITISPTTSVTAPFPVALAIVPLLGPLRLYLAGEPYDIDGSQDQHELARELSRRNTERARALLG